MNIIETGTRLQDIGRRLSTVSDGDQQVPAIAQDLSLALEPVRDAASVMFGPMSVFATHDVHVALEHGETALRLLQGAATPSGGVDAVRAALVELGNCHSIITGPSAHDL